MVRPRLVEEGKPITANAQDGQELDWDLEHRLFGPSKKEEHLILQSREVNILHTSHSPCFNMQSGSSDQSMSDADADQSHLDDVHVRHSSLPTTSLSRAAAALKDTCTSSSRRMQRQRELMPSNSKSQYRFVIGGESSNRSLSKFQASQASTTAKFIPSTEDLQVEKTMRHDGFSSQFQYDPLLYSHDFANDYTSFRSQHTQQRPHQYVQHYQHHLQRTHFEIGTTEAAAITPTDVDIDHEQVERMEGVVADPTVAKPPLMVIDGANVAYEYGHASASASHSQSPSSSIIPQPTSSYSHKTHVVPNVRGIQVAVDYFESQDIRVLVVLSSTWLRHHRNNMNARIPRKASANSLAATRTSLSSEECAILSRLQKSGRIVASPPADDDDAYAITLARRESSHMRLQRLRYPSQHELQIQQTQHRSPHHSQALSILATTAAAAASSTLSSSTSDLNFDQSTITHTIHNDAFVLSNDLFRDAQIRDPSLKSWLIDGSHNNYWPGRVSYTFAYLGSMDHYGDPILDFVPNPRHGLIAALEEKIRRQHH